MKLRISISISISIPVMYQYQHIFFTPPCTLLYYMTCVPSLVLLVLTSDMNVMFVMYCVYHTHTNTHTHTHTRYYFFEELLFINHPFTDDPFRHQ
jgi:Ca2+/H+ antiporter